MSYNTIISVEITTPTNSVTGDGTIYNLLTSGTTTTLIYQTNVGSVYASITGLFRPGSTGTFLFHLSCEVGNVGSSNTSGRLIISINGFATIYYLDIKNPSFVANDLNKEHYSTSPTINLVAGDLVNFYLEINGSSTKNIDVLSGFMTVLQLSG